MPGRKMLSRGYTTFVALLCTAAVAFAIHANGEAAKAGRAAERAQTWERYARATRAHRRQTAKSYGKLVRQYNALARTANARQKRLLASLSRARRHAATASPSVAAQPVTLRDDAGDRDRLAAGGSRGGRSRGRTVPAHDENELNRWLTSRATVESPPPCSQPEPSAPA